VILFDCKAACLPVCLSVSKFETTGRYFRRVLKAVTILTPLSHLPCGEKQIIRYLTGNSMEIAAKQFMATALVSPFAMTIEFPQKRNGPLQ
jgi:hypothetical protein